MWTLNFQMFKLVLEKAEEPGIKLPTSAGSWEKQESSRKTSISALLTMPKPLTVDHDKLWKILKEMGIPDHLTCLLRNPYTGQEATVRTRHGTTDWFQIGKGVHQHCILSPCLFNLYAEFSSVQLLSHVWLFVTPWITAHPASLSITNSRSLPKLMSHWAGDAIHLSSVSPPAFSLSQHQDLLKWVSSSHQVAKVLEFQLQHRSFRYSGLISFRMDW